MVVEGQTGRLWVGPLVLILLVTLIYIFSILPQSKPSIGMDGMDPTVYSKIPPERLIPSYLIDETGEYSPIQYFILFVLAGSTSNDLRCLRRGQFNETTNKCVCHRNYRGDRCEKPVCYNGGWLTTEAKCRCPQGYAGTHCEMKCNGGQSNETLGVCVCTGRLFGPSCEFICMNGEVVSGYCNCYQGYVGFSCNACSSGATTTDCSGGSSLRRTSINSRLTLSGLSFCLITIGLLCVTAGRRRRLATTREDTWFRILDSAGANSRRCRYDVCTGVSTRGHRSSRVVNQETRQLTPPPMYSSVEQLPDGTAPPTYEEATAVTQNETVGETSQEETPSPVQTPLKEEQLTV